MFQIAMVYCIVLVGVADLNRNTHNDNSNSPVRQPLAQNSDSGKGVTLWVGFHFLQSKKKFSLLNASSLKDFHPNGQLGGLGGILHRKPEFRDIKTRDYSLTAPYNNLSNLRRKGDNDKVGYQRYVVSNVSLFKRELKKNHYTPLRGKNLTASKHLITQIILKVKRNRQLHGKRYNRSREQIAVTVRRGLNHLIFILWHFAHSNQQMNEEYKEWKSQRKLWSDITKANHNKDSFERDHSVNKRAAPKAKSMSLNPQVTISHKSCIPCASFRNYHRFTDNSCAEKKSQCLRCQCPNKIPCDNIEGNMTICDQQCGYGWKGPNCLFSVCPQGYFSPSMNCSLMCSQKKLCHPITGEQQPNQSYTTCPRYWFGKNCHKHCHCWGNRVCDPMAGMCPQNICSKIFTGPVCNKLNLLFLQKPSVHVTLTCVMVLALLKQIWLLYKGNMHYTRSGVK